MTTRARRPFELRGWHVLTMLLTFFGIVIAVNVLFAVIATRSFPGEDVRRSYLQGLRYNDTLAERRAQAALGWRAAVTLRGDAADARVEVSLTDRDGRPLAGLNIGGDLRRPTQQRLDRPLVFTAEGAGRYVARVSDLPPGVWRLRARAEGASGAGLDFESEMTWTHSH